MENQKYFVGMDIGTDSVGYAVTDESYSLCKFKGEPMWGVTLFEEAKLANERRSFRTARRRLDRRQQRVQLLSEIFATEIAKVDPEFYTRIRNSYLYRETPNEPVRLFQSFEEQQKYGKDYPTIHHLICKLMSEEGEYDVRLVYIACAWLLAHRGHFLKEVDKQNIHKVTDFTEVYANLVTFLTANGACIPWDADTGKASMEEVLRSPLGITAKTKLLKDKLLGKKKLPKELTEEYPYSYNEIFKLLCGGKVALSAMFGKVEYEDLEEKSVALSMDDEKFLAVVSAIEEDGELLLALKQVYDWSVLVDILGGYSCLSEAKVAVYEQHKADLRYLKKFVKKYLPTKYHEIFRNGTVAGNYVAYSHNSKSCKQPVAVKNVGKDVFCAYLQKLVKNVTPESGDREAYEDMMNRLSTNRFLPKQVDGDNRVIPYQLYWYELEQLLEKASTYLPFLAQKDEDGITPKEKILSIMEFRVPYYVGPLKTNPEDDRKRNCWMVRKAEGRILPWNFNQKVDLDRSEDAFIRRMTNTCTYLPGESVLPKQSLAYSSFCVLNEINNLKINGNDIPVVAKQGIYTELFLNSPRVTPKMIRRYLESNQYMTGEDMLSGIDTAVASTLKSYKQFARLFDSGTLTQKDAEEIIYRASCTEDKSRFRKWLQERYPKLQGEDVKYLSAQKFKDFGRLSKAFLCELYGEDKQTGEVFTILEAMWTTNNNLMQLLSDRFTFRERIEEWVKEYYATHSASLSQRLDEMYVSNTVKRQIFRTLDVLKDVVKIRKAPPARIFVEMARGATEEQKGKRTKTRYQQLHEYYDKVDAEEVPELLAQLDAMGEEVHNRLQSDKLFLYFIQLGKCLYTGKPIDIESVIHGDGKYNIEHIYPRSFVKDDSVLNNKILVDSKENGDKSDIYPIPAEIRNRMQDDWYYLHKIGLLTDEKFKRLTRAHGFTEEERYEFINRQLVETRQSTKVVASLLKEMYPDTEVVYVKAGLVSEFRQEFGLLKSRQVNDLHHAKDAYLNIVTGNVWHSKFSRAYYRPEADNNIKPEALFAHNVYCGKTLIWQGQKDIAKVKTTALKNTPKVTRFAFCRKGGFFDQMPLSAAEGLIPRKQGLATEIYGGYNKSTATFFVLARYRQGSKWDIMVMPVELLHAKRFLAEEAFAQEYGKSTIGQIVNDVIDEVEYLLNKRVLKVNTMLSLDGFRVCISGKSGGGRQIILASIAVFKTNSEVELYIKKLESFARKKENNDNILWNEKRDGISVEKNMELYEHYVDKFGKWPYNKRPANPKVALEEGRSRFAELTVPQQVETLLQIQGLFGRAIKANLKPVGGVESAGVTVLSSKVSNWKKNYQDVRIIDTSPSGLFEKVSENLLELL